MFSTTIAFPLSAGRMVRSVLSFRVFSAALSVFFRLSLGREELFMILTVSCLASSAISTGRDDCFFHTGQDVLNRCRAWRYRIV